MSDEEHQSLADLHHLSPNDRQKLGESGRRQRTFPVIRLFLIRYETYPNIVSLTSAKTNTNFHYSSILNYLITKFGHDPTSDIIQRRFNKRAKQFFVEMRVCDLKNGIIVCLSLTVLKSNLENPNLCTPDYSDDHFLITNSIKIAYLHQQETTVKDLVADIEKMHLISSDSTTLRLICHRKLRGYYLQSIKIKQPFIYDLAIHYGEEFVTVHQTIFRELSKKNGKGIVLLHGIPGSGKTHYIRHLIGEIKEKKLIYVPPDMAKNLSQPSFLAFLLKHDNSILIIEDAENIVRDRNEATVNPTQAVANLLNLSDGLLGDALSMQIIATFNSDLTSVDKALLRPGRLIANYAFKKLDVSNAKLLSNKLGFGEDHITEPMTLAEIYNPDVEHIDSAIVKEEQISIIV